MGEHPNLWALDLDPRDDLPRSAHLIVEVTQDANGREVRTSACGRKFTATTHPRGWWGSESGSFPAGESLVHCGADQVKKQAGRGVMERENAIEHIVMAWDQIAGEFCFDAAADEAARRGVGVEAAFDDDGPVSGAGPMAVLKAYADQLGVQTPVPLNHEYTDEQLANNPYTALMADAVLVGPDEYRSGPTDEENPHRYASGGVIGPRPSDDDSMLVQLPPGYTLPKDQVRPEMAALQEAFNAEHQDAHAAGGDIESRQGFGPPRSSPPGLLVELDPGYQLSREAVEQLGAPGAMAELNAQEPGRSEFDRGRIEGMHDALDLAAGVDPATTMAQFREKLVALIKDAR